MKQGARACGRAGVQLLLGLALTRVALAQDTDGAQRLARELVPRVERAAGLTFRRPPVVAVRGREQVRGYLNRKMAVQYPPAEMRAVERTYRAFGLVDDTVDVRRLVLDLYAEQVAGFYDPDSSMLFVVRGADAQLLRPVLAHELAHALQDQYTRLAPVLGMRRQNDRQMAAQAVFEGQANLVMAQTIQPDLTPEQLETVVNAMREGARTSQASMPVFSRAPRFFTESMIFPYVEGASFILAFEARRAAVSDQPYGPRLPVSTEQVLHPARYAQGDVPQRLDLGGVQPGDTVLYEDNFGEFETRTALEAWGVPADAAQAAAAGWDGDRYRVMGTRGGTVVVWASAWDSEADAADFERRLREGWTRRRADAPTRGHFQIDRLTARGVSVVRLVDAPTGWPGWSRLPAITLPPSP